MILPNNLDAIHKAWLNRVLTAITDNAHLVTLLRFKGGTCAAMRGLIERFSVDLDFDLIEPEKNKEVQLEFEKIFKKLDLEIKDKSHINVTFPAPNCEWCSGDKYDQRGKYRYGRYNHRNRRCHDRKRWCRRSQNGDSRWQWNRSWHRSNSY